MANVQVLRATRGPRSGLLVMRCDMMVVVEGSDTSAVELNQLGWVRNTVKQTGSSKVNNSNKGNVNVIDICFSSINSL